MGWCLPRALANISLEYLLPHAVCQQPGLQTRRDEVQNRLRPRSPCSCLPECHDNPAIPNADRDVLLGWSAKSSGRYARVARSRVANMQKAVVHLIYESNAVDLYCKDNTSKDPFSQCENLQNLQGILQVKSEYVETHENTN